MLPEWWRRWLGRRAQASTVPAATARLGVEALEDRMLLSANLFQDINRTSASSLPFQVPAAESARLGKEVYFTADDGDHPNALWKTDGTARGTSLVAQIGAVPLAGPSTLANLTAAGGRIYFTADDGVHGNEVWVSDGTTAGTQMLLDINPTSGFPFGPGGPNGSQASQFTAVGGMVYFTANDGSHGQEVWVTDGSSAGTHLVKDINPDNNQPFGSFEAPSQLTAYQGNLWFIANDGVNGNELWKSDGSDAGTLLVKDVNPGPAGFVAFSFPSGVLGSANKQMMVSGGTLFFVADDGSHGVELWKTDGSSKGTVLVKDINTGTGAPPFVPPGLPLPPVPAGATPDWLTDVKGTLYFSADDGVNGRELWKSDGSAEGTVLVKDLLPGSPYGFPGSSSPVNLVAAGGKLYFLAQPDGQAQGLWVSDGTDAGTVELHDLTVPPPSFGFLPPYYVPLQAPVASGNSLYFTADDGVHGQELWKTDGTVAGTQMVKDVRAGTRGSQVGLLADLGGKVLFAANDGHHGRELWTSDGSATGTRLVKDLNSHTNDANPHFLTRVGDTVFFVANDGVHGEELWKTDGTVAGTRIVRDINAGTGYDGEPAGSSIHDVVTMGGILYFVADDDLHGDELWRSDGTTSGTRMVRDINTSTFGPIFGLPDSTPVNGGAAIGAVTVVGSKLYFTADDGTHGRELWISDGTRGGTHLVKDINDQLNPYFPPPLPSPEPIPYPPPWPVGSSQVTTQSSNPDGLSVMGGKVYFSADDTVHGRELWVSDGTEAGTHLVKDIYAGANTSGFYFGQMANSSSPGLFTVVGKTLFFVADDGVHGTELWKTDGTTAGTRMVRDIQPGTVSPYPGFPGFPGFPGPEVPASSMPNFLTAIGGTLYFSADDGHGLALWKSDGTTAGTKLVRSFAAGEPYIVTQLTNVGGTLYFTADDGVHGYELWKSDGTRAGTVMVKDIYAGEGPSPFGLGTAPNSSVPIGLKAIRGVLYFTADDGTHGRELWKSDGTSAGTKMVQDVNPSAFGGFNGWFDAVVVHDTMLFTANDGVHGNELWTMPV